jgi:hypothetical protein
MICWMSSYHLLGDVDDARDGYCLIIADSSPGSRLNEWPNYAIWNQYGALHAHLHVKHYDRKIIETIALCTAKLHPLLIATVRRQLTVLHCDFSECRCNDIESLIYA